MKVAIVGSREYPHPEAVRRFVRTLDRHGVVVVSGGAPGVDRIAVDEAERRGIETLVIAADWVHDGRRAGLLRNHKLVAACDRVVAFWDGHSRGTEHTITIARQAGKAVTVYKTVS